MPAGSNLTKWDCIALQVASQVLDVMIAALFGRIGFVPDKNAPTSHHTPPFLMMVVLCGGGGGGGGGGYHGDITVPLLRGV